jgi:hypothetical protein
VKYDNEYSILLCGNELALLNLKNQEIVKTTYLNLGQIKTGLYLENNQIYCGSKNLYHINLMI